MFSNYYLVALHKIILTIGIKNKNWVLNRVSIMCFFYEKTFKYYIFSFLPTQITNLFKEVFKIFKN